MIASLPFHKYVWVDSSHIRTNGTGFEPAVWFGLVSQYGRTWGLNVMLECGAIYRSLPPHAIGFGPEPQLNWAIPDAQMWDCYADKFMLHEYAYLREMTVRTKDHTGIYLFTAAFTDDGFTRAPEQQKEFSFIELDNGRLTIQPTNRTLFEDRSFTVDSGAPKDLVTQTKVWSCE
ncbi:hypothetical protein UFOVP1375_43 [uncultured Caudovirales phage]|uniref:Uncharacterized protein n=1 Tax=uncultured Caudovirales phage TaxID=2100421 RepID=A0A6J5R2Z7_9CAUD|nr:hypothetical protein UFOVP1107_8 [uncultured Caudovirales phage]CAB4187931.1 hypothetical protein UFOVP1171_28 [uncultured Caudovirales phage]CAB4202890.1 hypothetical protein UFOVP1375_43 [uncultured Caudovirales phage]CAB4214764.1 hypothetical protein UFOVP1471_3 [uncultured Caudovirales phage]